MLLAIPALLVGVLSAGVLWALDEVAEVIEHALWHAAPEALGISDGSRWWIFAILTLTGQPSVWWCGSCPVMVVVTRRPPNW